MIEGMIGSIISGIAGNSAYDLIKKLLNDEQKSPDEYVEKLQSEFFNNSAINLKDPDIKEINGENVSYHQNYIVFDSYYDFYEMIKFIKTPVVHIIVEDKPSTAWHLPLIVAEDTVTNEWYIFSKGRLAFEGLGGGIANSRDLVEFLIENKIRFSAWILDYILSEKLSQGCRPWPELREHCIPLIAYSRNPSLVKNILSVLSKRHI